MNSCVSAELVLLHRGKPRPVFVVAAEALWAIPGDDKLTLLDMGCASGYYSEALTTLVGDRFEYTGSDYSDAMLAAARGRYPDTTFLNLDIRHIELPDRAYDVVFSGAVLVHIRDWRAALAELARVTASYLVLHRTPITTSESSVGEGKAYGVPVLVNSFNRDELTEAMTEYGFRQLFESQKPFRGNRHITYVFERL